MLPRRFARIGSVLCLAVAGFVIVNCFLFSKYIFFEDKIKVGLPTASDIRAGRSIYGSVGCSVDGGKLQTCLKDGSDVYFPFNLIKKQFDVSGKYSKDGRTFEWITSYAKVKTPDEEQYDPSGPFGHFASYHVENRDRVRCINGETGVPMSTQWDVIPYYYPIQIAQYGLEHYSRLKASNFSSSKVVMGLETKEWKGSAGEGHTSERIFFTDEEKGSVVNITSSGELSNPGCYLYLNSSSPFHILSFEYLPYENVSFTLLVRLRASKKLIVLNYVHKSMDPNCVSFESGGPDDQKSFVYSLGESFAQWRRITRNIVVDAARAMSSMPRKKDGNVIYHAEDVILVTLSFRGILTVRQRIDQRTEADRESFITVADWFVRSQNEKGGWSVPVERSIADRKLVLPAGWHSAMAQGHAISVLTRALILTGEVKYGATAIRGLDLFEKPASEGGVTNSFMGNIWYEEYPTTPGSFVLNGFMYSLIGLYDLSMMQNSGGHNFSDGIKKADKLFKQGLQSLRTLLPLYDTGSGSVYDLRHVGLKAAPNLARWDYHGVHVYLLKWLVQITKDTQLNETANRWIDYSNGKRAKHN